MLSIKVFELGVIHVGEFIVGKKSMEVYNIHIIRCIFIYITIKVYIEVPH